MSIKVLIDRWNKENKGWIDKTPANVRAHVLSLRKLSSDKAQYESKLRALHMMGGELFNAHQSKSAIHASLLERYTALCKELGLKPYLTEGDFTVYEARKPRASQASK